MLKNTLIIALVIALIYLYYQQKKTNFLTGNSSDSEDTIRDLQTQLKTYQQGDNWESKSGEIITDLETENKRLDEILTRTANEKNDLESERDEAIRNKKTAEQEVLSLGNKLQLKSQEADNKVKEIQRLKKENSQSEMALNKTLKELREKYSNQGKLLDEEQSECNRLEKELANLNQQIASLETERKNLLAQANKNDDLDEFMTWLNEDEERKANLPDWEKIIAEIKSKIQDYHLQENNWASGLLKRNGKYWQVFKNWIEND